MTAELSPPRPDRSKVVFNIGSAAIFLLLSLWMLIADVTFSSPILIQSSSSSVLFFLFISLWFVAAIVIAAVPKRFSLGIFFLFMIRSSLGWPLSLGVDSMLACRIADALLLLVSAIYLVASVAKKPRISQRPWIRWQHSAFLFICWISFGIISMPMGFFGLGKAMEAVVGDYVKLTPSGVSFTERVFEKDGQRVHLVGMVHIGDPDYYRRLNERMHASTEGKRLILTEGVSDNKKLLDPAFASGETYARLAKRFGLALQGQGAASDPAKAEQQEKQHDANVAALESKGVHYVNADIDVSQLPEKHLTVLNEMLGMIDNISRGNFFLTMPDGMTDEQLFETITDALVKQRNDHLMEVFKEQSPDFTEVYIPWGAAHLAELELQVLGLGFIPVEESTTLGIDFWKRFR